MRVIFEDENIALGVEEKNTKPTAVITFTSLFLPKQRIKNNAWNSFSFGFNEKFISTLDQNAFYFVSKKNNWYETESFDIAIKCLLNDQFFIFCEKRVLHSASMGAYACLKACNQLKADYLFLGSPQFSIDKRIARSEVRWKELTSVLTLLHNDAIKNINAFKGKVLIILDPNHSLDMKQLGLSKINILENVIFLPGCNHMSFQYLMKAGLFELCCKLAFSFDDHKFFSIRNVVDSYYVKTVNFGRVEKALNLHEHADIYRELSLLDCFSPTLRVKLIKKALRERPDGPYIKKIFKELKEKFNIAKKLPDYP